MSKQITQKEAAELAGVKKQAIQKLQKTRSFFTDEGKVDTEHPDWKSYLREKKAAQKKPEKRIELIKAKEAPEDFHWGNFTPETIQEEKIYADIISKKIDIMKDMDMVIDKKIIIAAFGEIIKAVQSNLVDYERRVAPLISAKLGLPGTEKTIEKIMAPEKKKSIENVIHAVNKAIDRL